MGSTQKNTPYVRVENIGELEEIIIVKKKHELIKAGKNLTRGAIIKELIRDVGRLKYGMDIKQ